jgi:hypothetical protein
MCGSCACVWRARTHVCVCVREESKFVYGVCVCDLHIWRTPCSFATGACHRSLGVPSLAVIEPEDPPSASVQSCRVAATARIGP